jgi:DNA-binding LacI/PurR family transcriptional regulator
MRNETRMVKHPEIRPQPTLEAVAERAGVSRATVSRVINGRDRVSKKVRRLVEQAVEELGYVPNRAARSLVTRRTDSVALVVGESETRLFSEPFFSGIVRGISNTLTEADFQLVLIMEQAHGERTARYLTTGHVDGVLLTSLHGEDPLPPLLMTSGVPTVIGGRPSGEVSVSYVDADNRKGAREAVEYLIGKGRRTIATITGPSDMPVGIDRLNGYRDALSSFSLPFESDLVVTGDFSQPSGIAAMEKLMRTRPDIDAVFAASDVMAAGALQALGRRGAHVPDDVAVVGFDDSISALSTEPPLTSVRQPLDEMGRTMASLLLRHILEGDSGPHTVILPTDLVIRSSA